MSGMHSKYALTSAEVDWNRARSAMVLNELGAGVGPGSVSEQESALDGILTDEAHTVITSIVGSITRSIGQTSTNSSPHRRATRPRSCRRSPRRRRGSPNGLRAHGIGVNVHQRPIDATEAYWPHVELAVTVPCDDVSGWLNKRDQVIAAVTKLHDDCYLPPTLVCPTFEGYADADLALTVITTAHPGRASCVEWFHPDQDPDATEKPLLAAVQRATLAMLVLSSLNELAGQRPLSESFAEQTRGAESDFVSAVADLSALGDDPVISAIHDLLDEAYRIVTTEAAGSVLVPGHFAAEVLASVNGEATEVSVALDWISILAIQWHHDRAKAIELLEVE